MRKIIVLSFISLDGVMQAPGGPEEDPSEDFKYGGWSAPFDDETSGEFMQKLLEPADLLLGRKTFDIFANYWPKHAEYWPGVNEVPKYVLSNTLNNTDPIVTGWNNSSVLNSLADIENLKRSEGADIKIWGSSKLVHLLLEHDLVDELWLMIHPVLLGKGKKLFADSVLPASFELTDSFITGKGVIIANYKRAGEVKTGNMGV
nr:dihydrofolate reductase family protein [uncultured Mucilaginibacter sp.]